MARHRPSPAGHGHRRSRSSHLTATVRQLGQGQPACGVRPVLPSRTASMLTGNRPHRGVGRLSDGTLTSAGLSQFDRPRIAGTVQGQLNAGVLTSVARSGTVASRRCRPGRVLSVRAVPGRTPDHRHARAVGQRDRWPRCTWAPSAESTRSPRQPRAAGASSRRPRPGRTSAEVATLRAYRDQRLRATGPDGPASAGRTSGWPRVKTSGNAIAAVARPCPGAARSLVVHGLAARFAELPATVGADRAGHRPGEPVSRGSGWRRRVGSVTGLWRRGPSGCARAATRDRPAT